MNFEFLIVSMLILVACCLVVVLYKNRAKLGFSKKTTELIPTLAAAVDNDIGCNLAVQNEIGINVVESREINHIPVRAHKINNSDKAINRVRHLASDLFKGVSSVSNKTVEIVFKPDIQNGLMDGTYTLMKTQTGEVLADAVNAKGTIVGKARLMQSGKARQIASGAFQLVSIAVAQSHLSDIELSLSAIKDLIAEMAERQENEEKANITGAFDYLREVADHMRELRGVEDFPLHKKTIIESIIRDSYVWRNKLEEDISLLIKQISDLEDLDTFGTGVTYKRLKELVAKINPLLRRRELFLNLTSAIILVSTYLDPSRREFSKIDPGDDNWSSFMEEFKSAVASKEATLISKSFWNSGETLELRKEKIKSMSAEYVRLSVDQQRNFISAQGVLEKSLNTLISSNGHVRVAISFDGRGEVTEAAIV